MNHMIKKALGAVSSALCTVSIAAAPSYKFVDLGVFDDAHYMVAAAINNQSQVAGVGHTLSGVSSVFMWEQSQGLVNLGSPVSDASIDISGFNNHGVMTLTTRVYGGQGSVNMASYLWQQGTGFNQLNAYDGLAPESIGRINDEGLMVGNKLIDGLSQAVVWQDGIPTALGGLRDTDTRSSAHAINNSGDIVGLVFDSEGYHSMLWRDGVATHLPHASDDAYATVVTDINDHGAMAGYTSRGDWDLRPFVMLPGSDAPQIIKEDNQLFEAVALNNVGEVIGWRAMVYTEASDNVFYWTTETGMLSLYDLIDKTSLAPGAQLQLHYANDINDKGQIVGVAQLDGRYHAYMLDPVGSIPEPHTWALLVLGLTAIAVVRRRG